MFLSFLGLVQRVKSGSLEKSFHHHRKTLTCIGYAPPVSFRRNTFRRGSIWSSWPFLEPIFSEKDAFIPRTGLDAELQMVEYPLIQTLLTMHLYIKSTIASPPETISVPASKDVGSDS